MKTMKAVITTGDGKVALRHDVPVPKPSRGQVLVRVVAAAQNPPDAITPARTITKDVVVGHDFAGIVEEVGEDVSNEVRKKGDRVAGFLYGALKKEWGGSFAEYCIADANVLVSIPETISFEDAATLGLAGFTACQILWQNDKFASIEKPPTVPFPVLVWGGASAVGQFVIQLAKLSGLQVITIASPKNEALLRSLGADAVFDYRDPEVSKKIREFTAGKLSRAIDCIAAGDTPKQVGDSIGPEGGYVACAMPATVPREDVESQFSLVFTLLGLSFDVPITAIYDPEQYALGIKFARILGDLLADGKLRTAPTRIVPGGLVDAQTWIDYQKEGKVSAEKIVYRIADAV